MVLGRREPERGMTLVELMVTMVEQGHLGRKTGHGFYTWDEDR